MCNKNCYNHTYHAIIVLLILSFLLLPNAPNINHFLHRLTDVTRSFFTARGGSGGGGDDDGGSVSPPCTTTTKMILAFLYGALFTLILMIISNNSNPSPPKQGDNNQPSSSASPYRAMIYMGPSDDIIGGASEGGGGGVGYALLRTFPTFAYSVRRRPKMGNGSKVCVICQYKFRDQELVRWLPECDHIFHICCIDEWLKSHRTCPCCRAQLDDNVSTSSNHELSSSNGITISPNEAIYYDDFNEYYYNVF